VRLPAKLSTIPPTISTALMTGDALPLAPFSAFELRKPLKTAQDRGSRSCVPRNVSHSAQYLERK
jgi:hypothetical protein